MKNKATSKRAIHEERVRQSILASATSLLGEGGLVEGLLTKAASAAGCTLSQAKTFFRCDEDIVLSLYARFATELEERVLELPENSLAEPVRWVDAGQI